MGHIFGYILVYIFGPFLVHILVYISAIFLVEKNFLVSLGLNSSLKDLLIATKIKDENNYQMFLIILNVLTYLKHYLFGRMFVSITQIK